MIFQSYRGVISSNIIRYVYRQIPVVNMFRKKKQLERERCKSIYMKSTRVEKKIQRKLYARC